MTKIEFVMSVLLAGLAAATASQAILAHFKRSALLRKTGIGRGEGIPSPVMGLVMAAGAPLKPLFMKSARVCNSRRIGALIAAAGLHEPFDAPAICAAWAASTIACGISVIAIFSDPSLATVFAGALLGSSYVPAWLVSRARARREMVERELPNALDWLSLSVEAGLDFAQALGRITKRMKAGPLKDEFMKAETSMRIGMTRRQALSEMAARAEVPALSSFTSMLIQADTLGTSIGPVLKAQGQRLRAERFARAEKRGAAAGQKALLPLALCIMPATFIIVFGPIIARLVTGGIDSLFGAH